MMSSYRRPSQLALSFSPVNICNFLFLCILFDIVWADSPLIRDCRSQGFDPTQLACSTCELFESYPQHFENCRRCCSAWLDQRTSLTQPYAAAVLVDRSSGMGEVYNFVQEGDLKELLAQKKNIQHISTDLSKDSATSQMRFMLAPLPSMMLFFDKTTLPQMSKPPRQEDVARLTKDAKERINLDGLERSDLKDMLLTLLA